MKKNYLGHLSTLIFAALVSAFSFKEVRYSSFKKIYADTCFPFPQLPRDFKGKSTGASVGVIGFSAGLHHDFYPLDSVGRKGFLYLNTAIGQFINSSVKRTPLNLSIVLDRSGSMRGEKIEYAREAAKAVIDKLQPDDMVSVVIYDQGVDILQPATVLSDKEKIKKKIDGIMPGGSTNLWGGSEIGYLQVGEKFRPSYINRVLLISDGIANAGITSNKAICNNVLQFKNEKSITLSTFGVGLDYNEILMTDMAEAGAGNYYFIDSPKKMWSIFESELNGMLHVAARNAELRVQLPKGVKVLKSFPYKYEDSEGVLTVRFRDLFSGESKGVLFSFAIDDTCRSPLRFVTSMNFTSIEDGKTKTLSGTPVLTPSGNRDALLDYYNAKVVEEALIFSASENMERALLLADKGAYETSRSYIEANGRMLRSTTLYPLSSELRTMDSVNTGYLSDLSRLDTLSRDSVSYLQKSKRAQAYKVRNKKG